MRKLSIGLQTIQDFKDGTTIYVDKTEQIYGLMQLNKNNFLVRPRRFGKSLLLDTIAAIYEGSQSFFKDTWIHNQIDWIEIQHPTLRIDFTLIEYSVCTLEQGLKDYLQPIVEDLGLNLGQTTAHNMFKRIIEQLGKTKPVVVLIDEYEIAVTDFVGKDEQKMNENIDTLKKFYGVLKGASRYIHRSFITGVSKIGKISILSDLNMLNDLTLDKRFSTLLGYTEKELRFFYAEYIEAAATEHKVTTEEILVKIKQYYNGYSWDGIEENKVYNPFSIVNFFQSLRFRNYWFNTGTPTLLVRGARKEQLTIADFEHFYASANLLESANLFAFYSPSLLFQAGYLTIKEVLNDDSYRLGFPNKEVRDSFSSYLLAEYINKDWAYTDNTIAHKLKLHLENEELQSAFKVFLPVISATPYDVTKHTEGFFHTIMHVLMYSTNLVVFSEIQNAQGRLDTVCVAQKAIYIFEFKINSSAEKAIAQIKELQYAARFFHTSKSLYIIGVNFQTASKKIDDILVEKWEEERFVRINDDFTPKE